MNKLGIKTINGVRRVTLKNKNVLILITQPDVFESPNSDTYVIFGEAKLMEVGPHAAERFKASDPSITISNAEPSAASQDDEEGDESGVEPDDIELVMTQASVSRSRAVKALKAADGDIVNAIMELTN
uniref:NAC-A/B domain-containing protein n=1 Tax=Setaria viridis TaxID=4556 RepID=A0A4U6UTK0_SETVI|nr:hypothetical protein SEVIR_5G453300v2 [Setaria viridis]